jgi:murein L,D-transpeptidase YcbB/YkuD
MDMRGMTARTVFTDTLVLAVNKFQSRHGYKADSMSHRTINKGHECACTERVKQILLNMDRMRWMPQNLQAI